jgi:hypothetical protein
MATSVVMFMGRRDFACAVTEELGFVRFVVVDAASPLEAAD